jgi:hypothetical protein
VSEIQPPPDGFVNRIATIYRQSDGHMAPVVRAVLASPEFESASSYFARYSWPVEYVVRAFKEVGYSAYPLNRVLNPLSNMGQQLFEPPDVAGWERGAAWFSTAATLARMNFAASLTSAQRTDIANAATGNGPTPDALLSFFHDRLTPSPVEPPAYDSLLEYLRGGVSWTGAAGQLRTKAPGLLHLVVGSSEYQLV